MKTISRNDAIAGGLFRYFTGRPCDRNHVSERFVSSRNCCQCNKEKAASEDASVKTKRHRDYYLANKTSIAEKCKLYRKDNRAAVAERNRAYSAKNSKRICERVANWRSNNPDKVRINTKKYCSSPKGLRVHVIAQQRRRALKASRPGEFSTDDVRRLFKASTCHICKKRFTKNNPATVDHVLALANELSVNDLSNLAPAHRSCNSIKRDSRFNPLTGQGFLV